MELLINAIINGAIIGIVAHIIIRNSVVAAIKQAFKEMEEAKAPTNAPAEVKPTRTDNTLVTKSGLVFERKQQQN